MSQKANFYSLHIRAVVLLNKLFLVYIVISYCILDVNIGTV